MKIAANISIRLRIALCLVFVSATGQALPSNLSLEVASTITTQSWTISTDQMARVMRNCSRTLAIINGAGTGWIETQFLFIHPRPTNAREWISRISNTAYRAKHYILPCAFSAWALDVISSHMVQQEQLVFNDTFSTHQAYWLAMGAGCALQVGLRGIRHCYAALHARETAE